MEMNVPSQSAPSASASTAPSTSAAASLASSHAAAFASSSAAARHALAPTPSPSPAQPSAVAAHAVATATASATPSTSTTPAARPSTTPQQVAAAAAAIAASRAATVSAAMRSVFGANAANAAKQAALASAMMTAAANATKPPAATITPAPSPPAAVTKPVATPKAATLTPSIPTPPAQVRSTVGSSVVVMQSSFDGLPVLPSQAAACGADDCARLHALTCEYDVPMDGAVSLYGEPTTRSDVRASLVQFYASTNQLKASYDDEDNIDATASSISEMTLRVDTELEMLRRQCFAERNARWQFNTPDMYTFAMNAEPVWVPAPYIGPRKKTQLLRKRQELQRAHGDSEKASTADAATMLESEALLQSLLGVELVRDRTWPPKEFVSKSNSKPSRGGSGAANSANRTSSGKKKPVGMAGIVDETPTEARVCVECHTQSSALWRKRPRPQTAPVVAPGLVTVGGLPIIAPAVEVEVDDVCLPCFLKTQRRDIFERKAAEKIRKAKEDAARAAAEARALKKQQQQMQKKLKKLAASTATQQSQPQTPEPELLESRVKSELVEELTVSSSTTLTFVLKDERGSNGSSTRLQLKPPRRESLGAGGDQSSGVDTWSSATEEKKKKSEKKSKKDKKKKKKKKKKKTASSDWDDSDSDDDGAASSVILPSPPQRQMDGFVYADRSETTTTMTTSTSAASLDAFKLEDPVSSETVSVDMEVETTTTTATKSKRSSTKRQSTSSSRSTTSAASSSKKRKSSDAFVETAAAPITVAVTPTPPTPAASSSRSSRAKASSAAAPPPPAASPAAAAATPSARKRARPTKKESARERELRALGQYCPVCNMTYEEDDASPFVCCDSCEMWVHAGCDASLSPEALAALADSNEKYICPLCSGR